MRPLKGGLNLSTLVLRDAAPAVPATAYLELLKLLDGVFLDLRVFVIDLTEGTRHALIVLEIVSPALALIGLDQSSIQ